MKGLKELKAIAELLDSTYQDCHETGNHISQEVINEARERLRELLPEKIYEVEIVEKITDSGEHLHDSYHFLGKKLYQVGNSAGHSQARTYLLTEINARRKCLGMPKIRMNQIYFFEISKI